MKHAYVFPGQGAQAVGMGKDLYDNVPEAKALFEQANEILGFRITDIMFAGTDEELKQTKVTQPAVFLHSVIMAKALGVKPDAVAGHSLGEFSALVVAGALSFEDGLRLVFQTCDGHAESLRSRTRYDGGDPRDSTTPKWRKPAPRSTAWSWRPTTTAPANWSSRAASKRSMPPVPNSRKRRQTRTASARRRCIPLAP